MNGSNSVHSIAKFDILKNYYKIKDHTIFIYHKIWVSFYLDNNIKYGLSDKRIFIKQENGLSVAVRMKQ